jgi:hypothetical protein
MYIDKLDGTVSVEFWQKKSAQWRSEQERVRESIEEHEHANTAYFEEGIKIIELVGKRA